MTINISNPKSLNEFLSVVTKAEFKLANMNNSGDGIEINSKKVTYKRKKRLSAKSSTDEPSGWWW